MRASKLLMMLVAVALVAVGPAIALAASQTYGNSAGIAMVDYRWVEGKVTGLDLNAKTLQVTPTDGTMSGPVRVAMGDRTVVRDGILHRTAADLKIGENVTLSYSGSGTSWVADNINILDPSVPIAHYGGTGVR